MSDRDLLLGNTEVRVAVPRVIPAPKVKRYFTKSTVERERQNDGSEVLKITMPNGNTSYSLVSKDGNRVSAVPFNGIGNLGIRYKNPNPEPTVKTMSTSQKIQAFALANPKKSIAAGLLATVLVGGGLVLIFSKNRAKTPSKQGKQKSKQNVNLGKPPSKQLVNNVNKNVNNVNKKVNTSKQRSKINKITL